MRIAVVHSFYSGRRPSGENQAVLAQVSALESAGHEVLLLSQETDEREQSRLYRIEAGVTVATGIGRNPTNELRRFSPDVVHVHNLFPNWGSSWLRKWSGAVVMTLHNVRTLCAAGTLYRDGHHCSLCPDGSPWAALKYRCYRDSALLTLPLVIGQVKLPKRHRLLSIPIQIIVLSTAAHDLFTNYGVSPDRLHIVPNFVQEASPPFATSIGPSPEKWLFAGRLSNEKGIVELIQAFPSTTELHIAGSGPLENTLRTIIGPNMKLLGAIPHDRLMRSLGDYSGLVFPSRCMEGLPNIIVEALSASRPLAVLSKNSVASLISETGSGVVVRSDRDWGSAIAEITNDWSHYSRHARRAYDKRFTPDAWTARILDVYQAALRPRK